MLVHLAREAQVVQAVTEVVRWASIIATGYLAAGFTLHLAQAHWSSLTGEARSLSQAADGLAPLVICFVIAVTATQLANQLKDIVQQGAPDLPGSRALAEALANFVINTVIFSIGATLAGGVAAGLFSAQLASLIGQPQALGATWARLGLVVVTGLLTVLSVGIAQAIVQAVLS
jgi:hypothetical protein